MSFPVRHSKSGGEMRKVTMKNFTPFVAIALSVLAVPAAAQITQNSVVSNATAPGIPAPNRYSFADVADLADHATIVVDGSVKSAAKIGKPVIANTGEKRQRFYVELDSGALIRGSQAMAKRLSYLVDMPVDSRGKIAKLKKQRVLIFARPVAGKADMVQLVSPDAQLWWDQTVEGWTRSVIAELLNTNAPARITGVSTAFHAPGNISGTGETQIFLNTAAGAPAALSISSREGVAPIWSANFGEVVGDSMGTPAPNSLSWYRFACGLPERLPASAFDDGGTAHRAKIEYDYALVRAGLGRCVRTRPMIPLR